MAPTKRRKDENKENVFINSLAEPAKRRRRALNLTSEQLRFEQQRLIQERDTREARERKERQREENERLIAAQQIERFLRGIQADGFTLNTFLMSLFESTEQQISSQTSRFLITHGPEFLATLHEKKASVMQTYTENAAQRVTQKEAKALEQYMRPPDGQTVTDLLESWSLDQVLQNSKELAPTLYGLLEELCVNTGRKSERRDPDLILATVISMLMQARNERANVSQSILCIYLLACGATRSLFEVLHHAGFSSSYSKAIRDIRELKNERLAKVAEIARSRAFMIVWDNINIAFRVEEQRHDSKDHFDNGTTATLIPLYGVGFGDLPLELKQFRRTRLPHIKYRPRDLLPSRDQVLEVEEEMLWQLEEILFQTYPALQARFGGEREALLTVMSIPLHKTEQYPLPAMHIDESSLDGTIDVLETIMGKTLKMSTDDIKRHGIVICAGDQLTVSLLDKASASRRDDSDLFDNFGAWTEGQPGLFHVKLAADRMIANEYWGRPNSPCPWSLWMINTQLARKPISVGWKAKKLTPFRPTWELIVKLSLKAHALDGFRIYSPSDNLDEWAAKVPNYQEIRAVARKVRDELFSSQRVLSLRALPRRDIPLENIIYFNKDALLLHIFAHAIKRGDIGMVINILALWMVMFRGTGSMPKYADALFQVLMNLKSMNPKLREAFLMNWLVNLTGLPNGFKEVDLLQEHHNFWAKIIYTAKGPGRSWDWLGMITMSIFALRDVIRHVKTNYKTPHNGRTHTSPDATHDINTIRGYLQREKLQSYAPDRNGNSAAVPCRDLMAEGVAYSNTARAYKVFRQDATKVRNYGVSNDSSSSEHLDSESMEASQVDAAADSDERVAIDSIGEGDLPEDEDEDDWDGLDQEAVMELISGLCRELDTMGLS
ncbi:hypothetical protein NEOLEDRAFT_1154640 [Neolentinus lepideus HHB14362 ss-1]|uniref:DUF6589 domain-containing protein n=1 Tax=Neolentinus lepideus HHB14362 ss-1 TaxID=1314782 RepID=A0A165UDH5_9AGAM|nr:hypothetical protein NEOLEDRAFT_1154640 [Neolentinus lepideus HHB14362 ss-1]